MKSFFPLLSSLIVLFAIACEQDPNDLAAEKTSPFSAVRFETDTIYVKVDADWYQLQQIDTLKTPILLAKCQDIYGDDYKKRFSEDLVEFLHIIDIYPRVSEMFTLKDSLGNIQQKQLTFSSSNRSSALQYHRAHYTSARGALDLHRTLSKTEMQEDLLEFRTLLDNRYSYLQLNEVSLDKELQQVSDQLPDSQTVNAFGISLSKILHKFGDGHSRVSDLDYKSMGLLPFETSNFQGNIICHRHDSLLHSNFPYLQSVNGISVMDLLDSSGTYLVQDASPQFVTYVAARRLRAMGFLLRMHRPSPDMPSIQVVFSNDQSETIERSYELLFPGKPNDSPSLARSVQDMLSSDPFHTNILEGNIGYLKIPEMKSVKASGVEDMMGEFEETIGLIIDVRNNGGGSRHIVNELMPYFIPPDQSPSIGNLAVYRTNNPHTPKEGFLKNRFMYPITSNQFSEQEKDYIRAFVKEFQPDFPFDSTRYSDWHFLLHRTSEEIPFYDKPVVVLMNEACYSATDIFLASFNQLDNVTLMGTSSGGGSGRTQKYILDQSHLKLRLSSIISFQPNGQLFDRIGVQPDVLESVQSIADVLGKSDHQLDQAKKWIHDKNAAL